MIALAAEENRSIGRIIEDAIHRYEREKFWQGVNEDYARLRADPVAWKAYRDDIAIFEGGSMDGLENEGPYYTPDEEAAIRAEAGRA